MQLSTPGIISLNTLPVKDNDLEGEGIFSLINQSIPCHQWLEQHPLYQDSRVL